MHVRAAGGLMFPAGARTYVCVGGGGALGVIMVGGWWSVGPGG